MLSLEWVNLFPHSVECFDSDLLHLGYQVVLNTDARLGVMLVNVVLELLERELVSVFELSVRFTVFLNGVVRQMDERIINVIEVDTVVCTTGSQVPFWEEE